MIRWRAVFRRLEMVVIGTLLAASTFAVLLHLVGWTTSLLRKI